MTVHKRTKHVAKALSVLLLGSTAAITFGVGSAQAAACGYTGEDDGYSNKATYNNCYAESRNIRVEYTYADAEMCVSTGESTLYANPDLGAVRNALDLSAC